MTTSSVGCPCCLRSIAKLFSCSMVSLANPMKCSASPGELPCEAKVQHTRRYTKSATVQTRAAKWSQTSWSPFVVDNSVHHKPRPRYLSRWDIDQNINLKYIKKNPDCVCGCFWLVIWCYMKRMNLQPCGWELKITTLQPNHWREPWMQMTSPAHDESVLVSGTLWVHICTAGWSCVFPKSLQTFTELNQNHLRHLLHFKTFQSVKIDFSPTGKTTWLYKPELSSP